MNTWNLPGLHNVFPRKTQRRATAQRLPFGLPKSDNANYLWIQYFYGYLNETGRAGFVMASSASDAGLICGLDFDRIEKEFLKADKRNTAVQKLKEGIEDKLNSMLDQNPLRIQFYERYQEIIDLYNQGKEYTTIKEIFDRLKDFYNDLSQEEKVHLQKI